jgi:hypothetical protein
VFDAAPLRGCRRRIRINDKEHTMHRPDGVPERATVHVITGGSEGDASGPYYLWADDGHHNPAVHLTDSQGVAVGKMFGVAGTLTLQVPHLPDSDVIYLISAMVVSHREALEGPSRRPRRD